MGFSIDKKGRLFFLYSAMHSGAEASLKRLSGLLTTESSTPDPVGEAQEPRPKGDLVVKTLSFRYREQPVLVNITCASRSVSAWHLSGPPA
jgi:ABC-type bacteriocin/lantibiotic exporter with double-glycine peptidase domain